MSVRTWWLLLGLLTVLSLARVASTHRVFSQIYDEPWHVAAGFELLTNGSYIFDMHHPPLARVLFALPFLGLPELTAADAMSRGNELLFHNEAYRDNLALARFGNLLFLALGIIAVALWGKRLFSPVVGLLAALLYASLPPILAHAGFATTDMAAATTLTLALYALTVLVEDPNTRNTVLLAIAVAAGLLAKYSFLIFFMPAALLVVLARRRFPVARLAAAAAMAFVLLWAAYGFSFATLRETYPGAEDAAREAFGSARLATIPLPAPPYIGGIIGVKRHDQHGHQAFLFGEVREHGWWYYFPVAFFFKTPIPFLILALTGCALAARRTAELPLIAATILAIAMTSHINIGVRHVLPVYAPLAICGALAIVEWRRLRFVAGALVLWLVAGVALAHPDYLPWFNGFARRPEEILSDSNLDWGQDVLRLADKARELQIPHMTVSIFTSAAHDRVGMPPHVPLVSGTPVNDWLAISEMYIAHSRAESKEHQAWLARLLAGRPFLRIGQSIRLYDLRTTVR